MQTRSILVKVAGVTFEGRQGIISMLSGKEPVRIVAEPDNKFDKNALAVHVSRGGSVEHIGYIPRDLAETFAPLLDGESVIGKIFEINGGFEKWNGERASYGVIVEFEIPDEEWNSQDQDC